MNKRKIPVPVLIGADLNCYNVARAFHEEYGVTSYAFGRYEIGATKASKFIKFVTVPAMDTDETFMGVVNNFYEENKAEDKVFFILGCTDDYANLVARNAEKLRDRFIVPYSSMDIMDDFVSKERFYNSCDKHGILYPATKIFYKDSDYTLTSEENLGFRYPIIVKPANSVVYWKHPFDGMNKVYVADSKERADEIIKTIFKSGYDDSIILQDMIPGDDSRMYVLTAYCGKDKKVKMMCLGHVLLEEHTPKGRGNHAAIIPEYNPELCKGFKKFLEDIGYVGFANFDIKYDERDNSYRAFEINLRQGRSNFYITASGENIARYLYEDYVNDSLGNMETKYVDTKVLWTYIPKRVIYKYCADKKYADMAKELVKSGKYISSLWYKEDLKGNPKRRFLVSAMVFNHFKKYKKYCKR
ncbi:MAG: hypothetical protein IKI97_09745 [Clostridia bacterium]|nr:hypothetical protein [Clostridia bacterium]